MKRRLREIVKLILNSEDFVTGLFISHEMDISLRTVRNDIKEINTLLSDVQIQIQAEHKKGYFFNDNDKFRLVNEEIVQNLMDSEFIHELPSTPSDRMFYILLRSTVDTVLDIDELSETLYVSSSTILKDIEAARKWVHQKLKIVLSCSLTKGVELIADEKQKRNLLSHIFAIKTNASTIAKYTNYLYNESINLVEYETMDLVIDVCNQYGLKMSGFSTSLLIIELSNTILRYQNGLAISGYEGIELNDVMQTFKEKYEAMVQQTIPVSEWAYISDCFFAKQFLVMSSSKYFQDKNVDRIINQFIQVLPEAKQIKKDEMHTVQAELMITILPMIKRLENGFCIPNEISDKYIEYVPNSFEKAKMIAPILKEKMNLEISKSELKYLAIQLEYLLKPYKKLKNIILVSDHDYGIIHLILSQFNQVFSDYGKITDVITYNDLSHNLIHFHEDIDFYITTSNIASLTNKPFAHINPVMGLHDLNEIRKLFI